MGRSVAPEPCGARSSPFAWAGSAPGPSGPRGYRASCPERASSGEPFPMVTPQECNAGLPDACSTCLREFKDEAARAMAEEVPFPHSGNQVFGFHTREAHAQEDRALDCRCRVRPGIFDQRLDDPVNEAPEVGVKHFIRHRAKPFAPRLEVIGPFRASHG